MENSTSISTFTVELLAKLIGTSYLTLAGTWIILTYILSVKMSPLKVIIEVLVCNTTFLLLFPILLPLISFNFLVRRLISKFLLTSKFHLIKGIDAVWAPVFPFTVPNFTSLYVLQGNCDIEKIRSCIETLVKKRQEYIRLNYRVTRKYGYYCWEDMSESFDIRQHVKIFPGCENMEKMIDEDTIFEKIQTVYDDFLPDSRPQWEILVVPRFQYLNKKKNNNNSNLPHYTLLFRMHHSILDGISAGLILQFGMADYPVKLSVDPLKPLKNPSIFLKFLPYILMAVLGTRSIIKSLVLKESNCFHGKPMTGPKFLGWSRPIELKALRDIKTATKSSTTSVLVSSFGGSLRKLAQSKKFQVPHTINAAATVAILPYPDSSLQNRFTSAHVPFEIGLKTPGERLKSAFKNMSDMSRSPDILLNYHMMQLSGSLPVPIVNHIMSNLNSTLLLSNVPGPAENVYLFCGHKLTDAIAFGPFKGKTALGTVLFSYSGKVRAAVVADKIALPEKSDLKHLLRGFEEEIEALGNSVGVTSCFAD